MVGGSNPLAPILQKPASFDGGGLFCDQIPEVSQVPRILISNDDGIFSRGIAVLVEALSDFGEVWVVAPDREQSAKSHSLTLHRPLRIRELGQRQFAIDGTPTDSVFLAINFLLSKDVDLVASGINHGSNLGEDVIYSGTVAAAREGALLGVPSMAVSMVGGEPFLFDSAVPVVRQLATQLLGRRAERPLLNVNVPNRPRSELRGVQLTCLGRRSYGNVVEEKFDPRGRKYYWIGGGDPTFEDVPGSDCNAVVDGYISVTPLCLDLTDTRVLAQLDLGPLTV